MSHFSRIATKIVDRAALLSALADLGYQAEVHEDGVPLHGFLGDSREQRAHVVVPRRQVGRLSNDIGFERTADGTYRAWISDFDARKHGSRWLADLTHRYAYHATMATLARQSFQVARQERHEDGSMRILVRRFT
jgi:hypothetical protein